MKARHWLAALALAAIAAGGGWWAGRQADPSPAQAKAGGDGICPGGAVPMHWKAPMDPSYIRDAPGKSPMGMDLVPVCPGEGGTLGGGIRIDPALMQSMGVRVAAAARRDLSRKVRAVGRVGYDERLVEHVHAKVQGWVERLFVEYEGELVQRGQPLLEIYSPELVSTQEELLLAARYRDATRESRYADLSQGGEDLFQATRRRLELWDVSAAEIDSLLATGQVNKTLSLHAPAKGVVTELVVREGMEIGPNDNLYTIADLSRVWVYVDVYEYELPWVREGQRAAIELSYLPGRTFQGILTFIHPAMDPTTRTARVRVELDNSELVLKPDMFADVTIETEIRENVLAVPEEAVIRSGRRSLVVAAAGDGHFSPREIILGIDSGDGWLEVRSGLAEGDQVVTSGQFLIDSESKLQEAVQKMLGPDLPAEHSMHDMDMPDEHTMHDAGMPDDHSMHDMDMPDEHSMHDADMPADHSMHNMDMPDKHSMHEMEMPNDHSMHDMDMPDDHSMHDTDMPDKHSMHDAEMPDEHSMHDTDMPDDHSMHNMDMPDDHSMHDADKPSDHSMHDMHSGSAQDDGRN